MFFPDKKIIFVHIPKTGGSSLESAICENSFGETNLSGKVYEQFTIRGFFKKEKTGSPQGHRHSPISEYNEFLNLKEYYSFTVLRNPFDQVRSLYNQMRNIMKIPSLEHFIMSDDNKSMKALNHYIDQYEYTHINGRLMIDKVFVFDRYNEAQNFVEHFFKIKIDREKKLWKTERTDEDFSKEMEQKFESIYSSSIELYNRFLKDKI